PTKKANETGGGGLLGFSELLMDFETSSFSVEKGDFIVLYSDCLLESNNGRDDGFGMERILQSIENANAGSADDLLNCLLSDFYSYVGDASELRDDLTVIVLKRL
ncbi:MAG: SpoIIE family protein phosphatase, partial [bacterium]|nr:SpoIIE family protein phosphatase [bacterium]